MDKMEKKIYMVGNTHIDPVWLWNRAEGMQEVKSSFASALDRLEEFPDFKFTHSSIAYLEWLKYNCPKIFSRIQEMEKEGRWEIAGGMWVEPDCDIPSGESFIRHFLYSKKFVEENFTNKVSTVYNVDSFGHGSNLPNIYKNCGMDYYLISRPGRKSIEVPPVFSWKAKDGSMIVTEMTGGEYMAWTKPAIEFNLSDSLEVLEKYNQNSMAVFYGVGNHGGGPTIDNIHSIHELILERPELNMEFASISDFFKVIDKDTLPVVEGELGRIFYGCYSSDNEIKRLNRKAEWILLKAEAICTMASYFAKEDYQYPYIKIEEAWKELLFNQFHDILAGTSIEPARNEAVDEFRYAIAAGKRLIHNGVQAIANSIDTRGEGFPLLFFNPTGYEFDGVVFADVYMPRAEKKFLRIRDMYGKELAHSETGYQFYTKESRKGILLEVKIPAFGYSMLRVMSEGSEQTVHENNMNTKEYYMSNGKIDVCFDEKTGCPSSLKKNGQELLKDPMSVKVFYDDRGSWGVAPFEEKLLGTFISVSSELLESNFLRTVYRSCLEYGKSEMVLDFILEKDSDLIKINGWMHNNERHCQISLSVPFVDSEPICRTETSFLVEERVINDGTEFYQHRFADIVGENGRGISVFNTTSYGMRQKGNEYLCILSRSVMFARGEEGPMELSMKNRFMDQGSWEFEMGILLHEKSIDNCRLFSLADRLHMPIEYLGDSNHQGNHWKRQGNVINVEGNGIAISSLKKVEDREDATIIRFFETEGNDTTAIISMVDKEFRLSVKPYEVKTVHIADSIFTEVNMVEDKKTSNTKAKREQVNVLDL